jgi:hypothetical protein
MALRCFLELRSCLIDLGFVLGLGLATHFYMRYAVYRKAGSGIIFGAPGIGRRVLTVK